MLSFISGNFLFSLVSTSLTYITLPNTKGKQRLPDMIIIIIITIIIIIIIIIVTTTYMYFNGPYLKNHNSLPYIAKDLFSIPLGKIAGTKIN